MRWIQDLYRDIKGHVKWFLLGLVWTFIVWVAHHLATMFNAPSFVIWTVILAASCAAFYFVARSQGTVQTNKQSANLITASPSSIQAFANLDNFFKDYSSSLIPETETNIRARAEKHKAGAEREAFLITTCARIVIVGFNEQLWISIYKSQIRALEELNKQAAKIDSLQHFYAAGLREEPRLYGNGAYSFTSWLAYLKTFYLVAEVGDSMSIAPRGREFLKYLVHTGRSANDRKG